MALPTKSDISTTKFSFDGSPFVKITQSSSINTDSLKFSFDGSPWWCIPDSEGTPVVNTTTFFLNLL